jgi:hypothetical protein
MPEVDPVTGFPKETVKRAEDAERYDRLVGQKGRADRLNSEIESEKGQAILNKIEEHLLNRVNFLIDNDGECRALKRVLVDIGVSLNLGETAAKNLMRLVMRK